MCDKSGLSNFVRKQLLLRGRMHKKMRLHGAPLRRALVASLCFLPSADAFYNIFSPSSAEAPSSAPAAQATVVADKKVDDPPPYSCGAQLRLPEGQFNVSIGEPPLQDYSLQDLKNLGGSGWDFATYMKAQKGGAGGGALGAKFRNFRREELEMYWDDGTDPGMYSGKVPAMGRTATTTYVGHAFKFVSPSTKALVARLVMRADTTMYIVEPSEDDVATLQSAEYLKVKQDAEWYKSYYETTGTPWLSLINRPKPELNMWPAERLGQKHTVLSSAGFWESPGQQSSEVAELNLTVISKAPEGPRVFLVENLLSDFECDHIVAQGEQVVRPSIVGQDGGFKSRTRTSENGWLRRSRTEVLETVHRRFADALGLPESMIHSSENAEELQVVRYDPGQQYQPHHDFSDAGVVHQRFLTLLLYISPAQEGGATSFPKAHSGRGLRVRPPKGSGVLFYSMLPDGNGDDLSLHAGEPVTVGRKWVCNLWVWDPKRGSGRL